jgi:hypothetical protein
LIQFLLFPYFLQPVYTWVHAIFISISIFIFICVPVIVTVIFPSRPSSLLNNLHMMLYLFHISPFRVDLLCCTSRSSLSLSFPFLCYLTQIV